VAATLNASDLPAAETRTIRTREHGVRVEDAAYVERMRTDGEIGENTWRDTIPSSLSINRVGSEDEFASDRTIPRKVPISANLRFCENASSWLKVIAAMTKSSA
jgi:hypothetical protein